MGIASGVKIPSRFLQKRNSMSPITTIPCGPFLDKDAVIKGARAVDLVNTREGVPTVPPWSKTIVAVFLLDMSVRPEVRSEA